jgi:ubiquinone/menaquinone biosynthesis C-methylase UbiE
MVAPMDSSENANTRPNAHHRSGAGRLFVLDLPTIQTTGRVFAEQSDLSTIHRVLDIASGDGAWAISAAESQPQMQIVGIDSDVQLIEQARMQAQTRGLENVSFRVMDPFQPLDVADGSFDLVNLRFMVGFTDLDRWPKLIDESLRLLQPGGIVRLTEADTPITTSPACERLSDLLSQALWQAKHHLFPSTPYGQNLLITPLLPRLLRNADCEQIRSVASVTNFSRGMQAHAQMIADIARSYQLMQPLLLRMGVAGKQEVESLFQQMLAEVRSEDFCGIGFYLTAWGKKP